MMLPGLGVWVLLSIACCIHIVRTNQAMFWLWIVLAIPWLGALAYGVIVILPSLGRGPALRRLSSSARDALDPNREHREAKAACDASPTVHNRMRLAKAAAGLGRHAEAEQLWAEAAQGIHAEDPVLLLGRAQALLELARADQALDLLTRIDAIGERGNGPAVVLARARALEALGRTNEAAADYVWAAERMPGLEAIARQAAFLARRGEEGQAREMLAEIDRRIAGANPQFRREGRAWRELVAQALVADRQRVPPAS